MELTNARSTRQLNKYINNVLVPKLAEIEAQLQVLNGKKTVKKPVTKKAE